MRAVAGEGRDYYRLFFQEPGVAEADFESDVRRSMLGLLYTISGDVIANGELGSGWDGHFPLGETMTDQFIVPDTLPPWLTEDDLDVYVSEMVRTGFRGGFNWYRNLNRLPGLLGPWVTTPIRQPSFYMGGSTDMIAGNTQEAIDAMCASLEDLRHLEIVEGAGHWLQQECPDLVNAALVDFLRNLDD